MVHEIPLRKTRTLQPDLEKELLISKLLLEPIAILSFPRRFVNFTSRQKADQAAQADRPSAHRAKQAAFHFPLCAPNAASMPSRRETTAFTPLSFGQNVPLETAHILPSLPRPVNLRSPAMHAAALEEMAHNRIGESKHDAGADCRTRKGARAALRDDVEIDVDAERCHSHPKQEIGKIHKSA